MKKENNIREDIVRIEEMGNKTFMIFSQGEVSESLLDINELDKTLSSKGFVRVHPKHLVNKEHLKDRFDLMTKWVTLDNGDKIPLESNFASKKENRRPLLRFIYRLLHIETSNSI